MFNILFIGIGNMGFPAMSSSGEIAPQKALEEWPEVVEDDAQSVSKGRLSPK